MSPERERDPATKVLQVMRRLVDSDRTDWGVRELAAAMGVSPSSMHRLLGVLVDEGFVQQTQASERYELGNEFYRLAWVGTAKFPLRQVALPVMREIVAACDETTLVASYDPGRGLVMFVGKVESTKPLRYMTELGVWGPVNAGASGLAILAFLPEAEQERIIARGLPAVTPRTITDPVALKAELAEIRRRGYAFSQGQRTPEALAISAPIRSAGGYVVGSLLVTAPEHRWVPGDEDRLGALMSEGARRISALVGYVEAGK